ncbi:MAG: sigma-70 family RNA polymerase sigma factor [Anaerolineae bacterium]|nr:sigma-70 family RNA polymerase sigma factor [Anaerolineae bacterium]
MRTKSNGSEKYMVLTETHHAQHMTEDDCEQVERTRRDRQAFRPLFQRYQPRVFAYVAYRVGRNQDAEDVVAEVFRRALAGLSAFQCEHTGSFAGWLFRIAHNEVARFHARLGRQPPPLALDDLPLIAGDFPDPERDLERREGFARLRGLIGQLAPRRQEIVTLRFFGELPNREIALALGLDERTVASHLCRALDDLERLLSQSDIQEEIPHAFEP